MSGTKISALPTLPNPPPAPVYEAVITNDGTTATNYQRPQGKIIQPDRSGAVVGLGVSLVGSKVASSAAGTAQGGAAGIHGGAVYLTGTVSNAIGGSFAGGAGWAYGGPSYSIQAEGADFSFGGGRIFGATATGGNAYVTGANVYGAATNIGGNVTLLGGLGSSVGGNVVLQPGAGAANGVLLVNNIGTVDPHVLNAKWQTSIAGVGFVGVYSKG